MKFALTLLGMVAAVKDDGLEALDADLDLDLEWDEDVVAVVTGVPDAEALAALTEAQRWEGYTYCVLEDACGEIDEWTAAVEAACEAGSEACGTLVDFFAEVEEIEEAYGSESDYGSDSGDDGTSSGGCSGDDGTTSGDDGSSSGDDDWSCDTECEAEIAEFCAEYPDECEEAEEELAQ